MLFQVEYLLDVCSPSTSIDLMINELSAIDHSQSAIAAEFERNNKVRRVASAPFASRRVALTHVFFRCDGRARIFCRAYSF